MQMISGRSGVLWFLALYLGGVLAVGGLAALVRVIMGL